MTGNRSQWAEIYWESEPERQRQQQQQQQAPALLKAFLERLPQLFTIVLLGVKLNFD